MTSLPPTQDADTTAEMHSPQVASLSSLATPADHALAGTVGGMAATVLFYPLDTIRTIMQVERGATTSTDVLRRYIATPAAFLELYRGLYPTLMAVGVSQAIYFFLYQYLKGALERTLKAPAGTVSNLLLAYCAGVINCTLTCPLWVVSMRMKLAGAPKAKGGAGAGGEGGSTGTGTGADSESGSATAAGATSTRKRLTGPSSFHKESEEVADGAATKEGTDIKDGGGASGATDAAGASVAKRVEGKPGAFSGGFLASILRLYEEEGWDGCFKGLGASLVLCSNPSIQFAVYENLRERVLRRYNFLTPYQSFMMGAFAKAVATVVTYPVQVVQSRARLVGAGNEGVLSVLQGIVKNEGITALFRGIVPKLLQTCSTSAFIFLVYEQFLRTAVLVMLSFRRRNRIAR